MSRMLSLALYCEGSTDERFLPLLIQRTVQDILHRKSSGFVTVMPVDVIKTQASKQAQCILQAAIQACDYHILFIHADADDATPDKALSQRYNPGYELVQQCSQKICKNL